MSRAASYAYIVIALVVLSSSLVACSLRAPAPVSHMLSGGTSNLTIDGAQHFQTIDGFGVNANSLPWDNGALVPALDQLTNTMGISVWRVIVESKEGWEDTPAPGDATSYDWAYYANLYQTPKFQALWGVLAYLQQKHAPTIMLNVMGCAPAWIGGCAVNPDKEDYYVRMESSLLYYARDVRHLRIDIFSPMNEEDHGDPEGPHVAPDQYVRILDKLSARLDSLGLGDIRFLGPDTAYVGAATAHYMPAIFSDASLMARIDHFGVHDYSGTSGATADAIAHSSYLNRTFWVTEYSAWCNGCDNGAPNPDDWDFATGTLDHLFTYIDQGASSALVYDGYDSYYEHHGSMGYWGLLRYDAKTKAYTPRKRFYTVAQVVKFARPGMLRIGAASTDASIHVFAFTDPKTGALTIVGQNPNDTAATLHGTLTHLPATTKLALYQTTQTLNMARGADVPVNGASFTAQIAANSVFTLTSLPPT
jgi:O-glycosyl hydrolase